MGLATGAILYISSMAIYRVVWLSREMDIPMTRSNSLKGLAIDSLAITSSAQFVFLENKMANGIMSSRDVEKARFCEIKKEVKEKKKFICTVETQARLKIVKEIKEIKLLKRYSFYLIRFSY